MRVLYLQYAGDFRDTLQRFEHGETETYYGQRYSVSEVIRLAPYADETTVVCCVCGERYDELRPEGVRTIGLGLTRVDRRNSHQLIEVCQRLKPSHVVLRFPQRNVIKALAKSNVHSLVMLADSANQRGFRQKIRNLRLASSLNSRVVQFVGNHQLNAAKWLAHIGVNREKILPYDWEHEITPDDYLPKPHPQRQPWRLLYCGSIVKEKGIGDVILALTILSSKGLSVSLEILGRGEVSDFQRIAQSRGVDHLCNFVGSVPHADVFRRMREADVVLVPSHHAYPEGLPMTLCESLIVRTPLIVSDHPMFTEKIRHRESGLVVAQKSPAQIADAVQTYMQEASLYESISRQCSTAWNALQLPLRWGDVIERWLRSSPEDLKHLLEHSLGSGRYDELRQFARVPLPAGA